jgi:hypothetical protein
MTEPDPKLTLADPNDLSNTLSFALRFEGKRRYNDSDRFGGHHCGSAGSAPRSVRLRGDEEAAPRGHGQIARGFGQKD